MNVILKAERNLEEMEEIWRNLEEIWTPKVCQSNRRRILGKVLLEKFWALIHAIEKFGRL